jgi:bisanhydrobacterioruberin hydratase
MERKNCLKSAIAIYLIFLFGILWHSIDATYDYVLLLTPFVLVITYVIVLYPEIKERNYSLLLWLLAVYVITFILEAAGVQTGAIFGDYYYGDTLGLKFLDVPIVIGFNWGMIIWGAAELSDKMKLPVILKVLTVSLAAVILDFLIEPVAMQFNYWNWNNSIIPVQNYIAWMVISIVFAASWFLLKIKSKTRLPIHFYFSQVVFFGAINLLNMLKV